MTRPRISAEQARALRERVARADAALLAWASPPFDRAGDLEHARTCGRGENPLCSRCAEPGLARSDLFNAATALTEEVEALHAELEVATKERDHAVECAENARAEIDRMRAVMTEYFEADLLVQAIDEDDGISVEEANARNERMHAAVEALTPFLRESVTP